MAQKWETFQNLVRKYIKNFQIVLNVCQNNASLINLFFFNIMVYCANFFDQSILPKNEFVLDENLNSLVNS